MALLVAGESGVSGVLGVRGSKAAAGLAVENLAEQVEEGQQLVYAADDVKGEHQVTGVPRQGFGGAILLGVFLWTRGNGLKKRKIT